MTKEPYRIRIVNAIQNESYIVRSDNRVSYFNGAEVPMSLSNLAGHQAATLRFALVDAADGREALKAVRRIVPATDVVTLLD